LRRNWLEWVALVLSFLAVALIVGYLAYDGLTSGNDPADPSIELHLDAARQGELGWIVPATMRNTGDRPAEALVIEATGMVGGKEEKTELDIDFLPAGTEVDIELAFSAKPEGDIAVRLVGFRSP
jgi:uncharacterized protein (TIGR02588 family)